MASSVRKRDGRLAKFDQDRITNAIKKAFEAVDRRNVSKSKALSDQVVETIEKRFGKDGVPTV